MTGNNPDTLFRHATILEASQLRAIRKRCRYLADRALGRERALLDVAWEATEVILTLTLTGNGVAYVPRYLRNLEVALSLLDAVLAEG